MLVIQRIANKTKYWYALHNLWHVQTLNTVQFWSTQKEYRSTRKGTERGRKDDQGAERLPDEEKLNKPTLSSEMQGVGNID